MTDKATSTASSQCASSWRHTLVTCPDNAQRPFDHAAELTNLERGLRAVFREVDRSLQTDRGGSDSEELGAPDHEALLPGKRPPPSAPRTTMTPSRPSTSRIGTFGPSAGLTARPC
jgi:hypothetical protein